MRRSLAALVTSLVVLGASVSGAAGAPPPPATAFQLARARAEYERGEYQRVVDSLAPELYPKNKIVSPEELKEAHYLLGSSYFFLGRQELARQEFTALLFLDPAHDLDPAIDPPRIYAFFQTLKHELAEKLRVIESTKKPDDPPVREVLLERTVHQAAPRASNFVPLGYGQFRNGQTGKGVFFLVSETLLGGTSLGLFTYQAVTYGIPARFSSGGDNLKAMQIAQVATGGAFLVLYGVGVFDAFANQKPDSVDEKRSERPLTPPPPAPKPKTSFNVVPLLSPEGIGLGAMGRF